MRNARFLLWLAAACLAQSSTGPYFGRGLWRGGEVDFRVVDGWAIVQGDIIIGRAADRAAQYQALLEAPGEEARARLRAALAVADQRRLWPGGVIPYEIDSTFRDTGNIDAALQHWNSRTSIRLMPRAGEANYVRFTPYEDPSVCGSSSLGMSGGVQYIFGTETCPAVILIHEIGHAVGLDHEQSRPDRDRHVRILWENLTKPGRTQFNPMAQVAGAGPYDYNSIMHYGAGDFARGGLPAMETLPPGIPIRQNNVLSDGDIDAVNRLYGNLPPAITISTTPAGLQVIVDGETVTAPRAFAWNPGGAHTLAVPVLQADEFGRYEFAHWSDGGEAEHTIKAGPEASLYVANFVRYNKFDFRVTPEAAGTVTVFPPSEDGHYRDGTLVSVTARPAEGYAFANWAGSFIERNSLTNLGASTISFFATADVQGLTARFTPLPRESAPSVWPVTRFTSVLASGGGAGALIRVDGRQYRTPASFLWEPGSTHDVEVQESFPNATDLSLRAFQKWNDGAGRIRKLTASAQAATYTATYVIKYGVNLAWNAGGNITVDPVSTERFYERDSTLTLTANPSPPSQFVGWAGDLSGRQNPLALPMTETITGFGFFLPPGVTAGLAVVNTARARSTVVLSGTTILTPISPGETLKIYSPDFGPFDRTEAVPDASGRLPTALAGVRVVFGGLLPAPLVSVARGEVSFIAPYALSGIGAVSLQLEYQGTRMPAAVLMVANSVPSIYTSDGSGKGQARVLNEDGSANSPDNPAPKGSAVTLFATGLGLTAPATPDGQISPEPGSPPAGKLEVRISGKVAEVLSAGLDPGQAGVHRIQVRVPEEAASSGAATLILTLDGNPSQFDTTMGVQ